MLFNSVEFFIFLAIVYTLYRALGHRGQNAMLLVASYVFYGWWDVRFLFLILLSTSIDYCAGLLVGLGSIPRRDRAIVSATLPTAALLFVAVRWDAFRLVWTPAASGSDPPWPGLSRVPGAAPLSEHWWAVPLATVAFVALVNLAYPFVARLDDARRRRVTLAFSLVVNLGILCVFKYYNFFVGSFVDLLRGLGLEVPSLYLRLILPVGISFYTFQSLSYTIDVYRGQMRPVRRYPDLLLYVSFFPQLVAGPIERAVDLVPRLLRPRTLSLDQSTRGAFLILLGLFKKVAVADGLAGSVNSIYNSTATPSWADVVLATTAFAFQIYCDFAGYSDIARGVAKLLGFELMLNFDLPYVSQNPSEFWRRWHISLSSWLRDYVYIPLGGNRGGSRATYRNLMLTMLLGGLWHGAAWNFVLWGAYQGAILCLHRLWARRPAAAPAEAAWAAAERPGPDLAAGLKIALFFAVTCYGWLLFRANSLEQIADYSRVLLVDAGNLASHMKRPTLAALVGLPLLILFELAEYRCGDRQFYRRWPEPLRGALYAVLAFAILLGTSNEPTQFIYFQF